MPAGLRQAGDSRASPQDGQHGRRFSDPLSQGHPDRAGLWPGDLRALRKHFGNQLPETIIEPGRGMVGNAGAIKAEVVLVSRKSDEDDVRWVFLDIGKFGGLAETMDEAIRYNDRHPARWRRDGALRARRPDLRFRRCAL
jgi:hypothetical protein